MRKCWERKMINTLWCRDILFYEQESKNYLFKNLEVIRIVLFHRLEQDWKCKDLEFKKLARANLFAISQKYK